MKAGGFVIRNARDIVFENVHMKGVAGEAYIIDQASDVTVW